MPSFINHPVHMLITGFGIFLSAMDSKNTPRITFDYTQGKYATDAAKMIATPRILAMMSSENGLSMVNKGDEVSVICKSFDGTGMSAQFVISFKDCALHN